MRYLSTHNNIKVTRQRNNRTKLISAMGELSIAFESNVHEVDKSCGVTHENNFFIYGGVVNRKQVLQLINCGLTFIGALPFNHFMGACDSSNGRIVLCFDRGEPYKVEEDSNSRQCRRATSPLGPWSEMPLSAVDHDNVPIVASPGSLHFDELFSLSFILDGFLTVGSKYPENVKAELYDFGTNGWTMVSDYPFGDGTYLASFDMVFILETTYFCTHRTFCAYDVRHRHARS